MKVVAVTACPTGIAHTYMAAESLTLAAKELGHQIKVETQGAMGVENEITDEDLKAADLIIFASDIAIDERERFEIQRRERGIKIIETSVKKAITNPQELFIK
ncbi:MAG: PTS fructose transporter subunit IIB [Oligoflexia bacterium]|nr:PTS fructose transporter subunit IIB [Oligoflexia bacterium]